MVMTAGRIAEISLSASRTALCAASPEGSTLLPNFTELFKIQHMDALEFLKRSRQSEPQSVYVVFGDEEFLVQQVREELVQLLIGEVDPTYAVSVYDLERASWPSICNDLHTLPFLSPRRVVVVEQADAFVSAHRSELEKYVAKPAPGTLILLTKSWVSTTKLAKLIPDAATISCKTPRLGQLPAWCVQRAKTIYKKRLDPQAAERLVEYCEPSLGLLDQELAKLATFVFPADSISRDDVERLVGRSRGAETFKIFEALAQGQPARAMHILQQQLAEGHEPMALLGAFSWQLRRVALAWRRHQQGVRLAEALSEADFQRWQIPNAEALMRQLGRRRLNQLMDWLLEADLGIKGNSSLAPSMQLERLLLKLIGGGGARSQAKP